MNTIEFISKLHNDTTIDCQLLEARIDGAEKFLESKESDSLKEEDYAELNFAIDNLTTAEDNLNQAKDIFKKLLNVNLNSRAAPSGENNKRIPPCQ